ncbi:hypothetical protein [Marinospirillum alkaliphilum]|uniref:Porin n=1 Tax=Marinospirillum alkaliphilum DSM 21637 TaxID=1122209 RepID=A0A1K1XEN5_9GAMM|nr:hypothetical protein [Marinospirillum alkaliphilum]SFX48146.1 hypothetical protein SAMN02745752_01797 [Marinospirillum alkaliphilum DSM 21637]
MKLRLCLAVLLLCWQSALIQADNLEISGYWQVMPVYLELDDPQTGEQQGWWDYRAQNRLNLRWFASDSVNVTWQMRTRYFAGDLVQELPGYKQSVAQDAGYFNLSATLVDDRQQLLHYNTDRLFVEWQQPDWNLRAGRQRINWGVNLLTNPSDLFNIDSLYAFDYPERPGADALRLQHSLGMAGHWELAASRGASAEDSVVAGLLAFNWQMVDLQGVAGRYRERFALGAGWASNLGEAGFKGEVMWFRDRAADAEGEYPHSGVVAISLDYMFSNGLFAVLEALWNEQGGQQQPLVFQPTADNPSLTRRQLASQLTYTVNPLLDLSLTGLLYLDEEAVFLAPAVRFSLLPDLDWHSQAQFHLAGGDSALRQAGSLLATSLQWNF